MGADRLAIADGAVVWSPEEGGVYRLPLKGGGPTLSSGTRGFYLAEWPWAEWPRNDPTVDYPIARPMEHLKNVLTGETRNAVPPAGRTSWHGCGVMWCFDGTEAWQRDGTGRRALPGQAVHGDLYAGRYVLLRQRDSAGRAAVAVHDLVTGRTGLLFHTPTRRGDQTPPTLHLQRSMLGYRTGRGTQVLVHLVPSRPGVLTNGDRRGAAARYATAAPGHPREAGRGDCAVPFRSGTGLSERGLSDTGLSETG